MQTNTQKKTADLHQLERLHGRSHEELEQIFRAAPAPESIQQLHGDPFCLGLQVGSALNFLRHGPLGFIGRRVEQQAIEPGFVWNGKSFHAYTGTEGRGINRLRLWGLQAGFPFKVGIAPSVIDNRPCIALNFDIEENPWWEKPTYDELREVSPGIYMGPSTYKTDSGVRILAWFGADTNRQVERPMSY